MVPSLFLAHGSPMIAIQNNEYTRFLASLGQKIKPKAIVIFTAHWESNILTISALDDVYDTIHDFYGFPEELYSIKYPAKGSTQVASLLEERFQKQGFSVKKDTIRGLDHGAWTLLYWMYPNADIPVVQVSITPFLPAEKQFNIGQALQGLGKEDILVIGSGATVHNLRLLYFEQETPEPWAVEFDDWLIDKIQNRDLSSLFSYQELAPHASLAVPRPEHFVPLFIAMGSGNPDSKAKILHRSYELGTLSYLSFAF